jgi:adenosylhomocysteine nucleosidase
LLVLIVGGLMHGNSFAAQKSSESSVDATPRIAIISAFEPELEKLRKQTRVQAVQVINGRRHYLGRLAGHDVVLVLCGYSMVNATMSTQTLLDHFNIREIVLSGIAGGVNPNLRIGDVTVPAEWGQYQELVFAREVPDGWDTGTEKTDFPNYGMMFPRNVRVVRRDGEIDKQESRFWFPTDESALQRVRKVAAHIQLSRCVQGGGCLKSEPRVVVGGNGVSGQTFVDNAAYRQWVWQTFKVDALDMETAAVATVAWVNRVPFIAFRTLSDLAGGGEGQNEMSVFFKLAADNSAAAVLAYLQAYPERKQ